MTGYTRGHDLAKLGLLAAVAAVAFIALFLYVTNRSLAIRRWDVYVRLTSAAGLRKGDPVVYRGVQVGEVGKIRFAETGDVLVQAKLLERLPLTATAWAELVAVDLFGRQSLVLRDGLASTLRLQPDDTVPGVAPTSMGSTVAELGAKADRLVGDTTVSLMRDVLVSTAAASRQLTALTRTLERVVASQHESLTRLTHDAAGIAHNLTLATAPGPIVQTALNLQAMTSRLDTTTQQLSSLLAQVGEGSGTLGLLLRDPSVYQRSEALLSSAEALMRDLKANPKRYINLKVF